MLSSSFSLVIKYPSSKKNRQLFAFEQIEASSLIKLFIVVLYLMQLQQVKTNLKAQIEICDYHTKNTEMWSVKKIKKRTAYSISELVRYSISHSDAISTNIIIDQLGGKKNINKMLNTLGFLNTTLMRDSFSGFGKRGKNFLIARTTADEYSRLLEHIFFQRTLLRGKYFTVLKNALQRVNWHTRKIDQFDCFYHKTGTCINGNKLTINDGGVLFKSPNDTIPQAIIVFCTSQSFFGRYYGIEFFNRLASFDKKILNLIDSERRTFNK